MSVLPVGFGSSGGVDTGDIGHSLRCRGAASAYLTRTFGTPTNNKIWTWSGWVKRSKLGALQTILYAQVTNANASSVIQFDASDRLWIWDYPGSYSCQLLSNQVFRDPAAFFHLLVATDTTQATAANRVRVYVNGVEITSWSTATYMAQNAAWYYFNTAIRHDIGTYAYTAGSQPYDGYLSRIAFVDGQALTPSSFGYLNTEINEWVTKTQSAVKTVVDAGGTNSFMLDFDDATSLTTLGYDKSSKGNNWTLNNFSLTAGTTYDHMLDVPGNLYATLNPLNSGAGAGIANGNLSWANTTTNRATVASVAVTTGKWVWEVTMPGNSTLAGIGLAEKSYITGSYTTLNYASVRGFNGNKLIGTTETAYDASGASSSGTVWRFELNMDGGSLAAFRDGVSKGTLHTWTPGSIAVYPGYLDYDTTSAGTTYINFGQAPLHASATYRSTAGGYFRDTPTAGFKALCQANLPTPAILNPSSAVAHRFEAGSGIAAAISSDRSGWSDWMEWFKRTDTTESWKVRFSDDSGNMMAFDTNGAKAAWSAPSAGTYLGAAFRVGATYGVVTGTYSGDSTSNKNISHSLGKAPTCGIVKNESTGTWYVWHTKMTSAAYFTTLNSATPPAQSNTNTPWGTGNWSSTQFMVTNNATNNLNATSSTYRYILFADIDGLLALLGHTGNASTDGAFESSGHKAQLLIEKDLSATTGFYLWSDKIDTYNVTASYLLLNTNAGTAAATGVDVCSNGTKYRSATIANAANPHMGISYSRTPGKYSLGR
jgi:hypothetical protein